MQTCLWFFCVCRLLRVLGVQDRFTAAHYAQGLRAMAEASMGRPLPEAQLLGGALLLADCVVEAQQVYGGGCFDTARSAVFARSIRFGSWSVCRISARPQGRYLATQRRASTRIVGCTMPDSAGLVMLQDVQLPGLSACAAGQVQEDPLPR